MRGLSGYLMSSAGKKGKTRIKAVRAKWWTRCFTSALRSFRRRVVYSYESSRSRASLSSPAFERVLPERQRDFRAAAIPFYLRSCFWRYFIRSRSVRLPIWSSADYRGVSFQPETRQSCNIIPIAARVSQHEHHATEYANRTVSIAR